MALAVRKTIFHRVNSCSRRKIYPDYVNHTWSLIYVNSEPTEAFTNRLVEAMQKFLATPVVREFIARIASEPMALAPAEMRKFQISETERFRQVAERAGINPQ